MKKMQPMSKSYVLFFGTLLAACHTRPIAGAGSEKHLSQAKRPGTAIFVDKVDNTTVMQQEADSGKRFYSYSIVWTDSLASINPDRQKEKYFQYDMQKDWRALANGDTLYPAFFQEKPGFDRQRKEGVIVFENARGIEPDSLLYRDSYGDWGTQIFVLKRNQP